MTQATPNPKKPEKTTYRSDTILDPAWKYYEDRASDWQRFIEKRENDYLNAVAESRKLLATARKNVEGLTKDLIRESEQVWKSFLPKDSNPEDAQESQKQSWETLAQKAQDLWWTPWKSYMDWSEAYEARWEEQNQTWIRQVQEQRKVLWNFVDQNKDALKKVQYQWFHALEDGVRPWLSAWSKENA
ncbi:hypothetical protein [Kyrpidia sp.]|uniref:hypothetical protein n=1 Tax=Kyrpidia sp. TaxID=2073077 RepID=UPI002588A1FF|nr:hypothetical protein [Kyrpidia sp.]MCL6574684.1 hypothetical protein [Kyrpidia sp.]